MKKLREAYHADTPIEVSDRGNRGVAIYIQDQTTEMLGVPFLTNRTSFTLATQTTIDTKSFTVVAGHSILVGDIIELSNNVTFMQARVLSVSVNDIGIDSIINYAYDIDSVCTNSSDNMLVDGSVTPVVFSVSPKTGQAGDMTRLILIMDGSGAMDFSTFGSDDTLTNGCLVRVKRSNGLYRNLFNFKSNGDFIGQSFDSLFQEKVGGGLYGFSSRSTFSGQDNRGVVIRLDGDIGEEFQMVIQDDLTSGVNTSIRMEAQGSEVQS